MNRSDDYIVWKITLFWACWAVLASALGYGQSPVPVAPTVTKPILSVPEVTTVELSKDEQLNVSQVYNLLLRAQLAHTNLVSQLQRAHKCADCQLDPDRMVLIKTTEPKKQ